MAVKRTGQPSFVEALMPKGPAPMRRWIGWLAWSNGTGSRS